MFFACLSFYILSIALAASKVKGPILLSSTNMIKNIDLSDDASTIVSSSTTRIIEVFKNSGTGFSMIQNFTLSQGVNFIDLVGKNLLISEGSKILIFEENRDGTYTQKQVIETNISKVECLMMSKDENYIAAAFTNGTLRIYKKNTTFTLEQQINDETSKIQALSGTDNFEIIATGATGGNIRIYTKINNTLYLNQTINQGIIITFLKITTTDLAVSGYGSAISFFIKSGGQYVFKEQIIANDMNVRRAAITGDFQIVAYGADNQTYNIYEKNSNNSYQLVFKQVIGSYIYNSIIDESHLYYILTNLNKEMLAFYKCPPECSNCSFPNNCSSCVSGFALKQATCIQTPTQCVNNIYIKKDICKQYCSRECKTCTNSKKNCYECAEFTKKNEKGECIIENEVLSIFVNARPFLNLVRRKGLKMIFMVVDDLWLYQYHQKEYDGTLKVVFNTISLIEEKQWEIIGLQPVLEKAKSTIEEIERYNEESNEKYMSESRKNNFFIDSTLQYFIFSIPLTLIVVFIFNRIFYALFNYEISKYLRPYCFWLILLDLIIQNNIQYFTFLGFRTFSVSQSYNFIHKLLNGSTILFFFVLLFCVVGSYSLYYYCYKKLARYFLINMYRFPSSYILMTITYGLRPFLKGLAHGIFFDSWVLQIWLLIGIEAVIIIVTLIFEKVLDSHKSSVILYLETTYYIFLIGLNFLMLCKYEYFAQDEKTKENIELMITGVIYFMMALLVIRYLVELKQLICQECKCKSKSSVSPGEGEKNQVQLSRKKSKKMRKKDQRALENENRNSDKIIRFESSIKKKQTNKNEQKVVEDENWSEESNEVIRYYMQKYGREKGKVSKEQKVEEQIQKTDKKKNKTEKKLSPRNGHKRNKKK